MNVLALQWDLAWEDREANYAAAERLLAAAAPSPGTLVVLTETFATGFSMSPSVSERIDGPTTTFLAALARKYGVGIVGGVAREGRNESLAFGPDGALLAAYAKMRPFVPGGEVYTPGTTAAVFSWGGVQVSPFVCYDLRFPEVFRQAAARWRPEVYTVIASWPAVRIHHWVRLLQARAIENQAFVVGVNRCGADPYHTYVGRSVIVDYHGEIVADAGEAEGAIGATLDLAGLAAYRRALPFLDDLTRSRERETCD